MSGEERTSGAKHATPATHATQPKQATPRRSCGPMRQRGWGASEYLAVLMGLMVVWRGAEAVVAMIQQHHDRFTWALMIPY